MSHPEFEEIQQIWDTQDPDAGYEVQIPELTQKIQKKARFASNILIFSELVLIFANLLGACTILLYSSAPDSGYIIALAILMFIGAAYIVFEKIKRIYLEKRFPKSLLGSLEQAIAQMQVQIRLTQVMRWYILPLGLLTILAAWNKQTSSWVFLCILFFFILGWRGGAWEKRLYVRKKKELLSLKAQLLRER
ncbi:MAG: hypothetical protein AAFU64_00375 [Bacteroidota bacterium]